MKFQWSLIVGLVFAIFIAIFAIVNVEEVSVNYMFGKANIPLILVILGATLVGALISISFAVYKLFHAGRSVANLEKLLTKKDTIIYEKDCEIIRLQEKVEDTRLNEKKSAVNLKR